jgi:tripartite-type tricarboxylate transporter receptor subunit TctC
MNANFTPSLFFAAALAFLATASANGDELEALDGQSIRMVVGGGAGAGTDAYVRPLLDGLATLLPKTTIRAQNVSGAGGGVAAAEVYAVEGSAITLVAIHNAPIYSQMVGSKIAEFDLRQFAWIGALTNNQRIVAVRGTLEPPTLQGLRGLGRQPIAVTDDANAPSNIETVLINAIAGLGLHIVSGVDEEQRGPMLLAGDADVVVGSHYALAQMIEAGDLMPVLKFAKEGYPSSLDDVPTIADEALPGTPPKLISLMESLNNLGRLIAAAPSTDANVTAALRKAFDQAVADPALAQTYADRQLVLAPTSGADLAGHVERLVGDDETRLILKTYLDCGRKLSDDPASTCD